MSMCVQKKASLVQFKSSLIKNTLQKLLGVYSDCSDLATTGVTATRTPDAGV